MHRFMKLVLGQTKGTCILNTYIYSLLKKHMLSSDVTTYNRKTTLLLQHTPYKHTHTYAHTYTHTHTCHLLIGCSGSDVSTKLEQQSHHWQVSCREITFSVGACKVRRSMPVQVIISVMPQEMYDRYTYV